MVPSVRTVPHRKSYTLKHKRSTVCAVQAMVANQQATNIASARGHLNVDRRLFYRWKCLLEEDGKAQGEMPGNASDSGKQQTAVTCQFLVLHPWPQRKICYMCISCLCIQAGWVCLHHMSQHCCDLYLNFVSKECR